MVNCGQYCASLPAIPPAYLIPLPFTSIGRRTLRFAPTTALYKVFKRSLKQRALRPSGTML